MNRRGYAKANAELILQTLQKYGHGTSREISEMLFKDFFIDIHPRGVAIMLHTLNIPYRTVPNKCTYPRARSKVILQYEWFVDAEQPTA